ncbi:unnamed protein product, partial [Mesorhabditis spiculigera]
MKVIFSLLALGLLSVVWGSKMKVVFTRATYSDGHTVVPGDDKYRMQLKEVDDFTPNDLYGECRGEMYTSGKNCTIQTDKNDGDATRFYLKIYTNTEALTGPHQIQCLSLDQTDKDSIREYYGEFQVVGNNTCHWTFRKNDGTTWSQGRGDCISCCGYESCDAASYISNDKPYNNIVI